ncbi:hypothetical protein [Thalassotalea insulae]|uniref:hypothetical protein n=1 Tax=Thalassotalea insulae TaxID=2056778 RepID=UPI0024E14F23|nr:hypothetical protein [Thalassotalea insulae]
MSPSPPEPAQLVIDQGYTIREAAEAMNVGKSTMALFIRFTAETTNFHDTHS